MLSIHGPEVLTTNRVAETAGVSIGSLYKYFPNKEAIVFALFDLYLPRIGKIIGDALDTGSSVDDIVRRINAGVLETAASERAIFNHLWGLRSAADAHGRIAHHLQDLVDRTSATLERLGIAEGPHARALAFVIIHTGDGLINATARTPNVEVPRVAWIYLDIFGRYLNALARQRTSPGT